MNKKAFIYFISLILILSSSAVYLILREMYLSESVYTSEGEYDIWITETSGNDLRNAADTGTKEPENILIDINTATADELIKLKGIGKAIAENIILYRQDKRGFDSIEEIKNVKGIGDKTFLDIKEHIYVKKSDVSQ